MATKSMAEVCTNLWIGSIFALRELPKGHTDVAWTVISLLSNEKLLLMAHAFLGDSPHHQTVWKIADKTSSIFLCDYLLHILNEIDKSVSSNRPCLVHCALGQSRSTSVIVAWLLSRKYASTLEEALNIIQMVRPQAKPNIGFVAALKAIERQKGDMKKAIEDWKPKIENDIGS